MENWQILVLVFIINILWLIVLNIVVGTLIKDNKRLIELCKIMLDDFKEKEVD